MELIYADPYYDTEPYDSDKFAVELAQEVSEFDELVSVVETDIGHGADWPVVLVALFQSIDWPTVMKTAGPITIFFLGDRIKKNLDAWLDLGARLKQLFTKRKPTRIDEKAAVLMVVTELASEVESLSPNWVSVQVVARPDQFPNSEGTLDSRPEATYLITVVLEEQIRVFSISSNGEILFKQKMIPNFRSL